MSMKKNMNEQEHGQSMCTCMCMSTSMSPLMFMCELYHAYFNGHFQDIGMNLGMDMDMDTDTETRTTLWKIIQKTKGIKSVQIKNKTKQNILLLK